MPTVDFTLEDVGTLVGKLIRVELVKEREHTRHIVEEVIVEQFNNFAENNLMPALEDIDDRFDEVNDRLERIEVEVKGIRRTVRKHSADIAELQSGRGL